VSLGTEGNADCEKSCRQKHLDDAHIDLGFQEMGRKTMPQRVRRYSLGDLGPLRGSVDGAGELARRQGQDGIVAGEQPQFGARDLIPIPKQLK